MRLSAHLLVLAVALASCTPASDQPLTDPGPVWAGITDTTALRVRIEKHIGEAEGLLDGVRAVSGPRTVNNTIAPFKRAEYKLKEARRLATMGLNAHPDSAFRAVAQAWEVRVTARIVALDADRTLYDALEALDLEALVPSMRHVVEQDLATYRRDGVDGDEATRERVAALRSQLTELGTRFTLNIFNDVRTIHVHPDSLRGMPVDWIDANASAPADADGLVPIQITPANAPPLLSFAENEAVRLQASRAFRSTGYPQNVSVIDSLRALRHELAGLLGFSSWAGYSLEPMMAASPDRVREFLDEVDLASEAAAWKEMEALIALRNEEHPDDAAFPWADLGYWQNKLREQEYGFDQKEMREYFPYAGVRDGILSAYEQMFGLEFRTAPEAPVWSEDAEPYEVWEGGRLVGRFYLDMHPREGKYGHFAAFTLRLGGGELPELALLCNFPGGNEGDPGLLTPGHVSTFFHEFGHLIHFLVAGRSPIIGDFEWDFVEAPSQLLEAWARDLDVLQGFARHHETGEPIPADLVAAYRTADGFGRALRARTNLWLSDLALDLHTAPPETDPTADVELRASVYLPGSLPEWLHLSTSLPHLDGYSSNYYTYVWSEVIARDLLTGFNRDDLLDPDAGRRYRDLVLAPTGTAPSAVLVERFLGRPFNADAWRTWLGRN